jgi:hypothetical protein
VDLGLIRGHVLVQIGCRPVRSTYGFGIKILVWTNRQMSDQIGRTDQQKAWHQVSDGSGLVGGMVWAGKTRTA